METINNIQSALELFERSSILQVEATERGDYKTGNKNYDKIIKAANFLKAENSINSLFPYLCHPSIGVRLWAAFYTLTFNEKEAVKTLEEIIKSDGMVSLTAETTLNEWKKGNLKF